MSWSLPNLPFFDASHIALAERLTAWHRQVSPPDHEKFVADPAAVWRELLAKLARHGFLDYVVPQNHDGAPPRFDIRAICIIREALAFHSVLTDTAFVMQGLGTAPLHLHPDRSFRDAVLNQSRGGTSIAALAITEPDAGSDVASIATTAVLNGDSYVLNGAKAWISNAGLADHYVMVARTGEAPGSRGLSAFLVDAQTPGLICGSPIEMMAPHPIGNLTFKDCRISSDALICGAGAGFKAVMSTFDVFRPSVGGAAVGIARRALAETLERIRTRKMFGRAMGEMETVQGRIADMVADTESAALAVYRAAWTADVVGGRTSLEASLAKLVATEAAFRVVDSAVQLFGALGVSNDSVVGQLYREVRPMRIYEGASEVQRMVIARAALAPRKPGE
jgi:acyl-CoA dehydrogenase